ncbi:Hypothetical predicted protein [Pelobates cultripes]|uniref:L1 transposable element RRM domain-containing protein n=1 Tax=Pelobates cultripes TaxID=61616 RepID=A0AAD1S9Q9_PELCU|nr:Hypothetical predicted protein [Pelobates cultripes]
MDDFIATPSDLRGTRHVDKMAPGSPDSEMTGDSQSEPNQAGDLSQIRMELSQISRRMLTKADTSPIVQELRAALREELAGLREDLSTLEQRVDEMESVARGCDDQHRATEVAVTRQGNMLLTLRRQVEDLENRSRRNNIRVRGLPEKEDEPLPDTLSMLFTQLLGAAPPATITIDRAHRALGPARQEGSPRDVVCCITTPGLRDRIMAAARGLPSIQFRGTAVSLYQDLSSLTLDARRALRPVTSALRDKGIPYRWGFPFSLQAKHGNAWITARWPEDVPRFQRALGLAPSRIRNWILDEAAASRRDPLLPLQDADAATGRPPEPRRRGGPNGPEE